MRISNILVFFFIAQLAYAQMPVCDISDDLIRQVTHEAFTIWALLDLAEREHISDKNLFYDQLCQTTLKLCKEVQLLQESGYQIGDYKMECFGMLFEHLHSRFRALPEMADPDIRHIHAIDVILHYADYFLKNNLCIEPDTKSTHASF